MLIKRLASRFSYKLLMAAIVTFTGLAIGGKYVREWLTPVPEQALSADLTRRYAAFFQKLDIQEIANHSNYWSGHWQRAVVRKNRETFNLGEYTAEGSCPRTAPFDVFLEKNRIIAYTDIDKTRITYQEYRKQVSACLDTVLANVQHSDAAIDSWKQR